MTAKRKTNGRSSHDVRKYDALYARYSSHAQDDGTSIAVQIESCERAAGKPLTHFIDQAKTGRTTGGRTELLRLMEEAEAGHVNKLYVYKYDRLGRAAETHVLVEDLEQHGVEVVSVTEGTNALARGVQLVVAADYSRVLAERTRAGLVQRHREGCWTGGPPPYGYRIVQGEDNKKRLAIHEEEAETVRFVFETYLSESIGLKEVARRVRARGVPTRLGGPWGFGTVRSILTNAMLIGEVRYLRRCFKLDRGTGRRVPRWTDEERHVVNRDESLRIIDDETFERAQSQLAANRIDRPREAKEVRPFTRHLFCAGCGNVFYARKSSNAKGAYRYYSCGHRQSHGPEACDNRASLREDKLLERVQSAMSAVFEDMDGVLDEVAAMASEALEANRSETTRLKGESAEADKFIGNLTRLLADPDIEAGAKKAIARQLAEQDAKREELREALEAVTVQSALDMDDLMADCRQAFLEAKANFAGLMTPAQVNRFIAEVVGPMTVLPGGQVVQKQTATTEKVAAVGIVLAGLWSGFRPLKHCSNKSARPLGTPKERMTRGSAVSRSRHVDGSGRQIGCRWHRQPVTDHPILGPRTTRHQKLSQITDQARHCLALVQAGEVNRPLKKPPTPPLWRNRGRRACEDDRMRGRPNRQPNLFVAINLEDLAPADHPLRPIKRMADQALAAMGRTFDAAYAPANSGGRPSVPPERLLKAMVLISLYTVRSERALCERITFDMLFRWFLDMTPPTRTSRALTTAS